MILLGALFLGLFAGLGLARARGEAYHLPRLSQMWLIPVAFTPQVLVAYVPATRQILPAWLATAALPFSLLVFLAFVWFNRNLAGMPLLMAGLVLNLTVIAVNGGWMPIAPETVRQLPGGEEHGAIAPGNRWGQKDIVLRREDTHLEVLADRFLLPETMPYQVAFSAGDILVAGGAFWMLARPRQNDSILE